MVGELGLLLEFFEECSGVWIMSFLSIGIIYIYYFVI